MTAFDHDLVFDYCKELGLDVELDVPAAFTVVFG